MEFFNCTLVYFCITLLFYLIDTFFSCSIDNIMLPNTPFLYYQLLALSIQLPYTPLLYVTYFSNASVDVYALLENWCCYAGAKNRSANFAEYLLINDRRTYVQHTTTTLCTTSYLSTSCIGTHHKSHQGTDSIRVTYLLHRLLHLSLPSRLRGLFDHKNNMTCSPCSWLTSLKLLPKEVTPFYTTCRVLEQ